MNIPTMRSLGLSPVLRDIALADRGIVLVTGATGSGKSTTLASMIDYRNALRTGHIVTIEDPVEFVYRHRRSIVTQREVGIDTHSFEEALRNTLRQAPQVICIGELRDAETVQFALHASETGHLVFATLHSTNATMAIERVLNFYPGELKEQMLAQLALNIKAIICQRLVPRTNGGRVCAMEVMINTPRVQDLIVKGEMGSIKLALAADNDDGQQSFDKSIYRLVKSGKVAPEEALYAAESANDLQMKFRGIGISASWSDTSDPWERIAGDYEQPASVGGSRLRQTVAASSYDNQKAPPMHSSHEGMKPRVPVSAQGSVPGPAPAPPRPPQPQGQAPQPGPPPQGNQAPMPPQRPAGPPNPMAPQPLNPVPQGPPGGPPMPPSRPPMPPGAAGTAPASGPPRPAAPRPATAPLPQAPMPFKPPAPQQQAGVNPPAQGRPAPMHDDNDELD